MKELRRIEVKIEPAYLVNYAKPDEAQLHIIVVYNGKEHHHVELLCNSDTISVLDYCFDKALRYIKKSIKEKKYEKADRIVVKTKVGHSDYNFGKGKPLLFETMVFGGERDGEMERYSTWEEAEAGHKKIVAEIVAEQKEKKDE